MATSQDINNRERAFSCYIEHGLDTSYSDCFCGTSEIVRAAMRDEKATYLRWIDTITGTYKREGVAAGDNLVRQHVWRAVRPSAMDLGHQVYFVAYVVRSRHIGLSYNDLVYDIADVYYDRGFGPNKWREVLLTRCGTNVDELAPPPTVAADEPPQERGSRITVMPGANVGLYIRSRSGYLVRIDGHGRMYNYVPGQGWLHRTSGRHRERNPYFGGQASMGVMSSDPWRHVCGLNSHLYPPPPRPFGA